MSAQAPLAASGTGPPQNWPQHSPGRNKHRTGRPSPCERHTLRFIAALMLVSQMAFAQDPASPEYRLVDLLGGRAQLTEIHQIVIGNMVRADPSLTAYRSTIALWAQQHLGWEEMREQMAGLYRKYFTTTELSEMLAFYSGPTGSKVVLLTPTLLAEASEIGARLTRAHKEELIQMLRQARAEAELP